MMKFIKSGSDTWVLTVVLGGLYVASVALTVAIAGPAGSLTVGEAANAVAADPVYRPAQAIDQTLGAKHVSGYFVSGAGCDVTLMIEEADPAARDATAARVHLLRMPERSVTVDDHEGNALALTCGNGAKTMAATQSDAIFALGNM